jgi:folate-binding protein YgfZ
MVTNDIQALSVGQGCYAAVLSPKGRVLATAVVLVAADALWLVADRACRAALTDGLSRFVVMDDVEVQDETERTGLVGLFGPVAAELLAPWAVGGLSSNAYSHGAYALPGASQGGRWVAWPLELAPTQGFLCTVEAGLSGSAGTLLAVLGERGAERLSFEALEVLRVEAGWLRYGVDVDDQRLPQEAALDGPRREAISFAKGCYIGQEPVARLHSRGHANWRLRGLVLEGAEVAAPGTPLTHGSRPEAGTITSSSWSPTLGRVVALAYVHRTVFELGTRLTVAGSGRGAVVVGDLPIP